MGIVLRQTLKASITVYFGFALGLIIRLFLFPKFLRPDEVGVLDYFLSAAFIVLPFVNLGTNQLMIKYYPDFKSDNSMDDLVSSLLRLNLISSVVVTAFVLLSHYYFGVFQSVDDEFDGLVYPSLIILIPSLAFISLFFAFASVTRRIAIPNAAKELLPRLAILLLLPLLHLNYITFTSFSFSYYLSFTLVAFFLMIYAFNRLQLSYSSFRSSKWVIKPHHLKYALLTALTVAGTQVVLYIDKFMVGSMLDMTATGVYSIAFYMAVIIEIPKRLVTSISMPLLSDAFSKGDMNAVKRAYQDSARFQMLIGGVLLGMVILSLELIYDLMPNGHLYSMGYAAVILIGLSKVLDMSMGLNLEIVVLSKYYKYNLVNMSVLIILTIFTNFLLIPIYGLVGAAIATLISVALSNTMNFLFIYYKLKISPFTQSYVYFLFSILLAIIVSYGVSLSITLFWLTIIKISIFIAVVIAMLGVSPSVRGDFKQLLRRKNK